MAKDLKFKLLSGDQMPLVGYGTFQVKGAELIRDVIDHALDAGYRLIDTAKLYGNEVEVGNALKELLPKYNLTRQDVFITTKLSPEDHGEKAYAAIEESLKNLDCGYIDLFLIHWPGPFSARPSKYPNPVLRDMSWQQLVKAVENGLTRNIGVSNYTERHLKELLANNHGIKPAVNQVEWHPYWHQPGLLDLCRAEGILLQAHSSLGGSANPDFLEEEKFTEIAKKLGKTPAQILLRWALQQNIGILPRSTSKERIQENIDLNFTIPDPDMEVLKNLPQKKFMPVNPDNVL